jgi:hypothetical protein
MKILRMEDGWASYKSFVVGGGLRIGKAALHCRIVRYQTPKYHILRMLNYIYSYMEIELSYYIKLF